MGKKRALAYLVLLGVMVGLVLLFRHSPVSVDVGLDLSAWSRREGQALTSFCAEFYQEDQWISTVAESYPGFRFVNGPPVSTQPVTLPLKKGIPVHIRAFARYQEGSDGPAWMMDRTVDVDGGSADVRLVLEPGGQLVSTWCRSGGSLVPAR
jgi:hypothetical protein